MTISFIYYKIVQQSLRANTKKLNEMRIKVNGTNIKWHIKTGSKQYYKYVRKGRMNIQSITK